MVVLGDSHIGKTSLVTRFAEGYYRENSRPATVGAFFVTKRILSSDNTATKIQIWDTAGAESFKAMAPMFYNNAAAVIVCYDVTRRESFEGMRGWLDEVRRKVKVGEEVVLAIAALKTDLLQSGSVAEVPEYEVQQLAEALGVIYLPTSAKSGANVEQLFVGVADEVLQIRQQNGGVMPGGKDILVTPRHNLQHPTPASDGRVKIVSPRRRDQFDHYYDKSHGNANALNDATPPDDKSRGKTKEKSRTSRPTTPSTTGTGGTDEGDLLASAQKKKKDGKKNEDNLCADEPYYTCHPAACGAVDGSSGCTVQ